MNVTQVTVGRFSQFHLARQLEKHGLLQEIWTGYPRFKLKDETGIPPHKIRTFPWLQAPYMARGRFGLGGWKWLEREWSWQAHETIDQHAASRLHLPTVLIGLSGSGLRCGQAAQRAGGKYICHRGSTHIRFQNQMLRNEYQRWGLSYQSIDERKIEKEEKEYEAADIIVVPSEFARRSFLDFGVHPDKVKKVAYGARAERFKKTADPSSTTFRLLWVGAVSVRKGFLDALHAFQRFKHPKKEFLVVGSVQHEMKELLKTESLTSVTLMGVVPNPELVALYNSAHAMVLSSVEEGMANVMGEALACGCPVVATPNSGAEDLYTDGTEGFIVPPHSSTAITASLEQLTQPDLQKAMSAAAVKRVENLGGWDSYGTQYAQTVASLQ